MIKFKSIEDIKQGDRVVSYNFKKKCFEAGEVINFISSKSESYYEIHHDRGIIKTTANHPFYVVRRGWTKVRDLIIGDLFLFLDGSFSKVNEKKYHQIDCQVYNLTIDPNHNYFANGILVHNKVAASPPPSVAAPAPCPCPTCPACPSAAAAAPATPASPITPSPSPSVIPSPSPSIVPWPGAGWYCRLLYTGDVGCSPTVACVPSCLYISSQEEWDAYNWGVCEGSGIPGSPHSISITDGVKHNSQNACSAASCNCP